MELQDQVLSFQLSNVLSRQIFRCTTNGISVLMMYDSGAQMPVWCSGDKLLLQAYPQSERTKYLCEISGFGKEAETCPVYLIPEFKLAIDDVEYKIKNLMVAELEKPFIGCDFLLSETMFSKADTLTKRRGKRELQIIYDNSQRPFICTAKNLGKEVAGITIWGQ